MLTLSSVAWYETKAFHTVIGACLTLITFFVTQYLTGKREKIKYRQTMLNWLVQSNHSLFSKIYYYSHNKNNIDYAALKLELNKTGSFIYILPPDLKKDFEQLYLIYYTDPEFYLENQHRIYGLMVSIVEKLHRYGVDAFGYK
jgi:hypothetical protein